VDKNPGAGSPAVAFQYAAAASGFKAFAGLANGYYYAAFMVNDGYQEISTRARFSVGSLIAQVSMAASAVAQGDSFTVTFAEGPGIPKDWIGLYRDGDTPGIQELVKYIYFNGTTGGQVTFDLPDLPAGRYWVAMFTNDSYTEVSNRAYFDVIALAVETFALENNQVRLRWKTVSGKTYIVQKSISPTSLSWQDVTTVVATGSSHELVLPADPGVARAFYRIGKQ
jgi:hypothetical protein